LLGDRGSRTSASDDGDLEIVQHTLYIAAERTNVSVKQGGDAFMVFVIVPRQREPRTNAEHAVNPNSVITAIEIAREPKLPSVLRDYQSAVVLATCAQAEEIRELFVYSIVFTARSGRCPSPWMCVQPNRDRFRFFGEAKCGNISI
jgi:hypothetical protein